MKAEIVQKQLEIMRWHGLAAMISCSPENFAYVAGFVVPSQPLIRHRHAMAILSADGAASLFCVDMEETTVRGKSDGTPVIVWREFHDDAMRVLADHLRHLGLGAERIGIEFDYLPAGDMAKLRRHLPDAQWQPVDDLLSRARQIKTADEIERMRKLSRIADQAIADSYAAVSAGDTELAIAAVLTRRIYELGADSFKLLIVATGERSQLPNVGPTARMLEPDDICRVEIFALQDGYQAGVCRTAYVRKPPPMAEKIWDLMVECKYRILEKAVPGASCLSIYQDFISRLSGLGLPPISFVGHGIGLHLHENPYLGEPPLLGMPGRDVVLEEGMVLGFEPLCYRTGYGFGVQNKDVLLVRQGGAELLSDYTDTDRLIRVG